MGGTRIYFGTRSLVQEVTVGQDDYVQKCGMEGDGAEGTASCIQQPLKNTIQPFCC